MVHYMKVELIKMSLMHIFDSFADHMQFPRSDMHFSPLSFSILVTLKVKVKSKGKVNMGVRTYPGHYQRV